MVCPPVTQADYSNSNKSIMSMYPACLWDQNNSWPDGIRAILPHKAVGAAFLPGFELSVDDCAIYSPQRTQFVEC
jgi:hypothetical protein